jgi:hypothetical protein
MSLEAYKLNGNGSDMFVCFQIRLGSWFESFGDFGFTINPWVDLSLNIHHLIALENKLILYGFQVQNVIFPDYITMHALELCVRSYGCFYLYMCVCVCSILKKNICAIYYLSSFLNKIIYLGLNYVILVFSRIEGLFQV